MRMKDSSAETVWTPNQKSCERKHDCDILTVSAPAIRRYYVNHDSRHYNRQSYRTSVQHASRRSLQVLFFCVRVVIALYHGRGDRWQCGALTLEDEMRVSVITRRKRRVIQSVASHIRTVHREACATFSAAVSLWPSRRCQGANQARTVLR